MNDLFSIQEKLLIHLIRHVTNERNQELIFLNRDILTLNQMTEPFDKLSYSQQLTFLVQMISRFKMER
jgi:aspartyl/asparaginyl-tRNA synthetase